MRTLPLIFALASTTAFAYDSTAEDVTFNAQATLFKGMDYSIKLPSSDSPVAIKFAANTDGQVTMVMNADSELAWPEGLQQTFYGVPRGGSLDLTTDTTVGAYVVIDAWGYHLEVPLWERAWTWAGASVFDPILLPGGSNAATVGLDASELFGLDIDIDITDDITVVLAGDLFPSATATVHGTQIETQGQIVTQRGQAAEITPPANNVGKLTLASEWQGTVDGTYGIDLVPSLSVCFDGSCLNVLEFHYLWELGTELGKPMRSDVVEFTHDIPAIGTVGTIDLGEVLVGEEVTLDVNVRNLGIVDLIGDATLDGDDGFYMVEDVFTATRTVPGVLTIAFAPEEEGTFTGTLIIASNDPIKPSVSIPVIGEALPLPPTDDGNGNPNDPNGDLGSARGCGCDSNPGTAAPGVALLALLGLAIRRRKA